MSLVGSIWWQNPVAALLSEGVVPPPFVIVSPGARTFVYVTPLTDVFLEVSKNTNDDFELVT